MSSYSAARIHVMRTKLISPEEYARLLRMSDKEIISYLQGSEYKEDVEQLSLKDLEDLSAFDKVLASNHDRMLRKLKRISSERFADALQYMLVQNDLWNLRLIAEALSANQDPKTVLKQYARLGTMNPEIYARAQSIQELARISGLGNAQTFAEFLDLLATQEAGKTSLPIDRYLRDEQNILDLVRLKRENVPNIMEKLELGGTVSWSILKQAADAKDIREALTVLKNTQYKEVMENSLVYLEEEKLAKLEIELRRAILKQIRRLTLAKPLGPEVLVHYLAEKEIEHDNLRVLIKGKRLGLTEEFIRGHII